MHLRAAEMQHIRFRIELQVWTCDVEKQTFEGEFCAYSGVWFLFQSNCSAQKWLCCFFLKNSSAIKTHDDAFFFASDDDDDVRINDSSINPERVLGTLLNV